MKMYNGKSCFNSIADLLKMHGCCYMMKLVFIGVFLKTYHKFMKKNLVKNIANHLRYIKNKWVLLLKIQFNSLLKIFKNIVKKKSGKMCS